MGSIALETFTLTYLMLQYCALQSILTEIDVKELISIKCSLSSLDPCTHEEADTMLSTVMEGYIHVYVYGREHAW